MASTFTFIADKATSTQPSWNNKDKFRFHYFNPNGAVAKWSEACDKVSELVNNDVVPSGWLFVYGSLNDFHYSSLAALASKKRIPSFELEYHVSELEELTKRIYIKLEELKGL